MITVTRLNDLTYLEDVVKLASKVYHTKADELKIEYTKNILAKKGIIILIYNDNIPIGFCECQLRHDYVEGCNYYPVAYLEGIFIREEYRMQGYAKTLLAECEKWAKENGCQEFASDCQLANDISIAFHHHLGFAETNRIVCFKKNI